ncbi:MAG TPA: glycosyltransferase family 2 protein [Mycobacteriales bacterium]|nr:glycosyltransferase family 2 protein [Mycobacteriales bacterium]
MQTAIPQETVQSKRWKGRAPAISVVVSTHGRAKLLAGLIHDLEAQDHRDFEVIVADNGSEDDTWTMLTERCTLTPLRLCALRLPFHDGPAVPRNTCIAKARGSIIAFTDDDCLPTATWLSSMARAFTPDTSIVQGRTIPEPRGGEGPWGRTLEVQSPSGLYETANLAARREAIVEVGGFGGKRLLSGRPFGEDVLLGAAIARQGGFTFAPDAVVHHRVMPGSFRDFLEERRRLSGFPLLVRLVPELRQRTFARIFLSKRTAITDLGLVAATVAVILGGPFGHLSALAALPAVLPWWWRSSREARMRPGLPIAWRVPQIVVADLVGLGALVAGSIRARRLLL